MVEALSLNLGDLDGIADKLVQGGGRVDGLRRLSGGASQETWALEVNGRHGRKALILRRAPGGTFQHETAAGLETEAAVICAVVKYGVPVPQVQYVLEPDDGLGRGFFTDNISGETIARKILRNEEFGVARSRLTSEFGSILAKIHAVPRDVLPSLRLAGCVETLELLRHGVAGLGVPKPVFEVALRWLRDRLPAMTERRLVHGDFRLGNLIIGPDGVRAVLDWELVHLGDPMEDLAWLCTTPWRFGIVDAPVAGIGQRDELFRSYESAGGCAVDDERVRWWEILSSLRWGVNCAMMVPHYRDGTDASLERAMIARRASENEIDLMRLIYLGD